MKTFSTFIMSLVVMALSLTSCAKKVDSPAGEYADDLRAIADKIAACDDLSDVQSLGNEVNLIEKYGDVDYTLTAEDKEALIDAGKYFVKVISKKYADLYDQDLPDGALEQAYQAIEVGFNNCTTLQDVLLSDPSSL